MSGYGNRVLALLIAALVPVTALATAWVFDVAGREGERLEQAVLGTAERLVARLEAGLAEHISALQAISASPLIDAGDIDGLRLLMTRARRDQPMWQDILLSDQPPVPGRDDRESPSLLTAGAGAPIAAPDAYREAFETGRVTVTPVAEGRLGVLVPVRRGTETRGVLTGILDPAQLSALLRRLVPGDWRALILDRHRRIVVRTSDGEAAMGEPPSQATRDAVAAGREGEIRRSSLRSGEPVVVMYLRSALTGWTVHAGFPAGALSVLQTRALQLAASGAVLCLLLSMLLAWLLYREMRASRQQETARAESQHLEALGRLTGGIAHDFNNLLMIMQSAARSIERRRDDPEAIRAGAQAIQTAVQRGAAITRQLLSYARKQRHSPSSFDLTGRADDLHTLLAQSSRGNIEVRLTLPRGLWRIYADPDALEVALINLATNARDAMPEGGRLTVSAANVTLRHGSDRKTGLRGDYVAITVADTGGGIEARHMNRIFQPFFTTKPTGQGTGLGLSQVYGFARQSGGTLTVNSKVGRGATFTLYLPRSLEAAGQAPAQPAAAAARAAHGHVLLVEDNAEVAGAIAGMLDAIGYTHQTVSSAADALTALQTETYDLVLSDILLGSGPTGLELEPRIRAAHPRLPVVLMTGYSETLADGTSRGLTVLSKPFREDELRTALQAAAVARLETV